MLIKEHSYKRSPDFSNEAFYHMRIHRHKFNFYSDKPKIKRTRINLVKYVDLAINMFRPFYTAFPDLFYIVNSFGGSIKRIGVKFLFTANSQAVILNFLMTFYDTVTIQSQYDCGI